MDLLKLARGARLYSASHRSLQRFADLILEEVARVCEQMPWSLDLTQADVAAAIRALKGSAAAEAERGKP